MMDSVVFGTMEELSMQGSSNIPMNDYLEYEGGQDIEGFGNSETMEERQGI
jgi:hypothetical protein